MEAGALPTDQDLASLRKLVARVAGAVATGVGVLGFVAVVGGASYWWRFSSAGLPADESVADLTHSQLLVLGVRELFPFMAILTVEAVALYLLEGAVAGTIEIGLLGRLSRYADAHKASREEWVTRVRVVTTLLAVPVAVIADGILAQRRTVLSLLLIAVIALVLAIIALIYAGDSSAPFQKFLLAAMATTALFGMSSGASRTAEAPQVRPVVIVTEDGRALAGLYVSASSDEVYVGEVCAKLGEADLGDDNTGSLLEVPRDKITLMLIGNNELLDQAISRESSLLSSVPQLSSVTAAAAAAVAPPPAARTGGRRCTSPSAALGIGS